MTQKGQKYLTLTCDICKKPYRSTTQVGLHVCVNCLDPSKATKESSKPFKPKALLCFVCGREFGTASLAIHQPQCLKKRAVQQSKLPPDKRTPLQFPPGVDQSMIARMMAGEQMAFSPAGKIVRPHEKMNMKQIDEFNLDTGNARTALMPECPNCGRHFADAGRLEIHSRSCTATRPAKRMSATEKNTSKTSLSNTAKSNPPKRTSAPSNPAFSKTMPTKTRESTMNRSTKSSVTVQSKQTSNRSIEYTENTEKETAISASGHYGEVEEYEENVNEGVPCRFCGRHFDEARIDKHESVCGETRKRKVFNSAAQRLEGVEKTRETRPKPQPKNNWRSKHEAFQTAIKHARMVTKAQAEGVDLKTLPPPPPDENPDYIQCPYCQRRFSQTAAERHIPRCKDIVNKPKPPPQRANTQIQTQTKQNVNANVQTQKTPTKTTTKTTTTTTVVTKQTNTTTGSVQTTKNTQNSKARTTVVKR